MKRGLLVFLAICICLSAAGCGTLLDGEYSSVSVSNDELPIKEGDTLMVSSYLSLRNAILDLVDARKTEEVLNFTGYVGNAAEDLPRVCAELKTESALCAYAVDYISYELNRIVSYYEARIFINYSRTTQELDALHSIVSVANAPAVLREAMRGGETTVTFSAVGSALTAEAVQDVADACYYDAPLLFTSIPRTTLAVYPNTGISRIYEISVDYGEEAQLREMRLAQLQASAQALSSQISGSDGDRAVQAAALLSEYCTWVRVTSDEDATAYSALTKGKANAEGMAMAYKALCDTMGIPCLVVSGRMDKHPHAWNMVLLGSDYFHVDVSQLAVSGSAVLRTDSDMRSSYWWDIDLYPASADPIPVSAPAESPAPTEELPAE